jgi:hypothetical protein
VIAKRKREEDEEKRKKIDNGISKYFSAKNAAKAPKAKVYSPNTCLFPEPTLTHPACCYCRRQGLHGGSIRRNRHKLRPLFHEPSASHQDGSAKENTRAITSYIRKQANSDIEADQRFRRTPARHTTGNECVRRRRRSSRTRRRPPYERSSTAIITCC